MSAGLDCRSLQVCLLFRFLSVLHEQASTEGILKTELSAWQGRRAGPGSSGLDQLSSGLVGLTGSQQKWRYFPFVLTLKQVLCSCANGQYFSSVVGALKATRNREGSGVTIWVSDVDSAAAIFQFFLNRPIGVDMSPGSVRESVSNQDEGEVSELSRELFLEEMPGTRRNICTSASLSGLQAGSVSSSIGVSIMSWCFLLSSFYWWFRLWCIRRCLVGCAKFVCRRWERSLLSFSPWMRILRLLLSSGTGVVFMAPSMTHRAMLWTLSSLLLLVLAAVPQVVDAYSVVGRTVAV